jgi:hypothetical protein
MSELEKIPDRKSAWKVGNGGSRISFPQTRRRSSRYIKMGFATLIHKYQYMMKWFFAL